MRLQILHVPDCPNVVVLRQHLAEALGDRVDEVEIRLHEVGDQALAVELGMAGSPTLLVDGHVAGVWRPAGDGIEATAFRELPERAWQELAEEARALVSFLAARDPAVYRRYAHWWKELPAAEVRLLPG